MSVHICCMFFYLLDYVSHSPLSLVTQPWLGDLLVYSVACFCYQMILESYVVRRICALVFVRLVCRCLGRVPGVRCSTLIRRPRWSKGILIGHLLWSRLLILSQCIPLQHAAKVSTYLLQFFCLDYVSHSPLFLVTQLWLGDLLVYSMACFGCQMNNGDDEHYTNMTKNNRKIGVLSLLTFAQQV